LWVLSCLGICAFPTSILFISEFLIVKVLITQHHYILCGLFVLLLTIILYGISRVVVKTAFGNVSEDKVKSIELNKKKITMCMYVPQFIMLAIVFCLGVYVPPFLNEIISAAIVGF